MIYTTNFASLGKLPKDIVPISIARKNPINWSGKTYKRLAPSWPILQRYKANALEEEYRLRYEMDVLGRQDPELCYIYLHEVLAEGKDFALVCYERPEKFCHRHIVADWFTKNGHECIEWGEVEEKV